MPEMVWDLGGVPRAKAPKSVSYTGCWTCRKRHIKCDERPVTCRTCEQAKLACAGYDVRLIWNAGRNTSRRRIKPDKVACASMTEDELVRALMTIEKSATEPATTITVGPFSVFGSHHSAPREMSDTVTTSETVPSQQSHSGCDDSPGPQHPDNTRSGTIENSQPCVDVPSPIPILNSPPITPESPDGIHPFSLDVDAEASAADVSTSSLSPSSSSSSSSSSPNSCESASTFRELNDIVSQDSLWLDRPSNPTQQNLPGDSDLFLFNDELAAALIEDTTATMLMHHYMQHVVHLMQPVSHPRNPFKTVYLPLALQGSSQLGDTRRWDQLHSASVAVFHSLLSTAATNLHSRGPEQQALKQLACQHKQRALAALQSALATKTTPYRDLMVAILSLVSADIMDGGVSDHWIHLEAGIKLQASRHYAMLVSRETRLLNSIGKMLHLFGETTAPHLKPKPWPGYDRVPRGADFHFLEPSIEFLYGITTSIAGAIFKIYRLSQYLAYYRDQEQEYPPTLLQACETLADELCSYTITSESFSAIGPDEAEAYMVDIARAQAKAFHHTALIYYYRSIQQCARSCLRQEQRAVLAAMNEAEDLKSSSGKESAFFPAPITWPAFVASCEAVGEDRLQWETWWSRVQAYGMRNYHQQYVTVRSIWDRLDEDELTDWREALAAIELRILPV